MGNLYQSQRVPDQSWAAFAKAPAGVLGAATPACLGGERPLLNNMTPATEPKQHILGGPLGIQIKLLVFGAMGPAYESNLGLFAIKIAA